MTNTALPDTLPSTDTFAIARDGTRLSYRLTPAQNPAKTNARLVLVHALAMDKNLWNGTIAALKSAADIITLDCRGHGLSDKPAGPYRVEQFADDIADILAHAGWESAIVTGASMGGCVALAFASGHGDKTDGLGLIDTTAWYGENAADAWQKRADKARDEGLSALLAFQKTRWFGDSFRENPANNAVIDSAVETFLANDISAYHATCMMLGAADLRSGLAGFDFPCVIRVGSEDYATPIEMAQAMASAIPDAKMEIMDGIRHFSPLEAPDMIAAALQELIGDVTAATNNS
ncbi:alpha/beta fold hydrolase [Thalassospira mesophila]|uniref:Lactone hydrolase n=1 Tax=Thalassospira mesophila TaxID=1293891 RepID=A0A1Y2KVM6_9PROT|nr:alpha/beta hydrolase [Thalassospira mesophila]OSQ35952.1 lactone hydrolase [Thalassospira mesophila]